MSRTGGWRQASRLAKLAVAALALGAFAPALAGPIPCRYEITAVIEGPFCPGFGNAPVYARGISNHDPPWVAGFYTECVIGPQKAFVWTGAGPMQTLNVPGTGAEASYAFDVTDTGLVVGAFQASGMPARGFVYDIPAGTWLPIDSEIPLGGCVVRAANNQGALVGNRTVSQTEYNAFIWHNGKFADLGVMNGPHSEAMAVRNSGTVTGWTGVSQGSAGNRAFLHAKASTVILPLLPNGTGAEGWALNDRNEIVGWGTFNLQSGASRTRGVIWREQLIQDLGVLPGFRHSVARDIHPEGTEIVGTCAVLENGTPWDTACMWINGSIIDLNTLIPNGSEYYLEDAYGINERGQILCTSANQFGPVAVILSPVRSPIGDVDRDCHVNVNDLLEVISEWGKLKSHADINQDGSVNVLDLLIVIENWDTS